MCVCFNINLWSNTVTKKINLTPAVPTSFWVLFQALAAPLLISFPATTWERGGRWSQVLGNSATMWETQKILALYFRPDEPRHLFIWGVNQGLTHLYITLLQKRIYLGGQSYRQKKQTLKMHPICLFAVQQLWTWCKEPRNNTLIIHVSYRLVINSQSLLVRSDFVDQGSYRIREEVLSLSVEPIDFLKREFRSSLLLFFFFFNL